MKTSIVKLGIGMLRIIYFPIRLLKVKNKIVYISRQFNNPTMDFILLKSEIQKIDSTVKNVFLTRRIEKGLLNSITYMFHMIRQMYHIATAKIVIVDTYCIVVSVLKHKKETKIIQIWHAMGAIKKFGYQTIGKKSGADKKIADIMCMHKNYDFVLCSSNVTKEYYCEAFNISEEKIKYIGMPRIDYILKKKNTDKIYNEYPQLKNKENILYVPTFRKGKKIKINQLVENFDTSKYNLIIKLHPLDHKEYKYIQKDGIIYDDKFKSYDLIDVADKVITDYSSLAIEVALLNKPVYFYVYDLDSYTKDPGLNFDFKKERIGRYMSKTPKGMLELLEKKYDYSVLEKFKNKFITVNTTECTKELSKYILELMNNEYKEKIEENINTNIKKELNV